MKYSLALIAMTSSLFMSHLPASAQQTQQQAKPKKPVSAPSPTDLDQIRITSLDLNGVDSVTALTQLLKPTKIGYDFAPEFYAYTPQGVLFLPPSQLTLRMQNVRLPKALNSVTKSIGIRWKAELEDGQLMIHFLPPEEGIQAYLISRYSQNSGGLGGQGGGFGGGGFGGQGAPTQGGFGGGGFGGQGSGGQGGGFGGRFGNQIIPLNNTRVKLDLRSASVRDILKSILEQAKIEYSIDEDIPMDLKSSFTFENVTITTALSLICESNNLGWRTEAINTGVLVRISKKYAPPTQ